MLPQGKSPGTPLALDLLRQRAWALSKLLQTHLSAIDGLWRFAEDNGLTAELGLNQVRAFLAEAFCES